MKKVIIWGIISVVVVVAIVVAGIKSGFVYLGFKQPQQVVKTPYVICGKDMIDRYNKIRQDTDLSIDEAAKKKHSEEMKQFVDDVKTKKDYDKDPTCAFMALAYPFYYTRDIAAAKSGYETLEKAVSSSGVYVDHRVNDVTNLEAIKNIVSSHDKQGDQRRGD